MTRTGLQVITDALKLVGVVAGHEVPTSAEQQDSFARLNELIDSWGTHAQTMFLPRRTVVPLVAGQQTYTVGDGGDVDVDPAPMTVETASYVVAGSVPTEVFLDVASDQAAVGVAQKALTGTPPQVLSYTRGAPLGELWVWPVPNAAVSVVLYWTQPLSQFPDLVTPVALAPGYAQARCARTSRLSSRRSSGAWSIPRSSGWRANRSLT